MADDFATVADAIAAVERRAASPDPLAQLAAGAAVAEELRIVGEAVLGHYVARARANGSSWTDIGRSFGVTKQAVQQRFVAPPVPIGGGWPRHFSERARDAVAAAQLEASVLGHNYLGTEHLLLGVLSGDGPGSRALHRLGVRAEAVRGRVEAIVGRGDAPAPDLVCIAPRAKRVMDRAVREARRLGCDDAGTEHLTLALSATEGVAAGILTELGVDEARLRAELADMVGADAPQLAAKLRRPPRKRFHRRER